MDKKAHRTSPPATPGARPKPNVTPNPDLLAAAAASAISARRLAVQRRREDLLDEVRPLAQFAEVIFFAGGAAGVCAVLLGATVEQRIWNSALALVS